MRKIHFSFLLVFLFSVFASVASAQNIDWLVNVDDSVTPAPAGGLLEVPVTVTNNGFDPAGATTVDIVVPLGTTFESFSGTITDCAPLPSAGGTTVTCNVPALPSSAIAELLFGIRTTMAGSPEMSATVPFVSAAGDVDINIANNSQSKNLTLTEGADVALTVAAPSTAASGEVVDYVFTATNNGPNDVTDLEFTFEQPSGLDNFVAPAGCTLGGSLYTCVIAGPVAVGSSVDLTFQAQVIAGGGSTVTALAEIGGGAPADPDVNNNSVAPELTVTSGSDLSIEKSVAGPSPLLVGDTTTFTLSSSYTGEVPTGLSITDTVPSNYVIQSVTPAVGSGWTCGFDAGSGAVNCTNPGGTLPGNNQPLGDIVIEVLVASEGLAENFATIASSDVIDPNPINDTDGDGGVVIEEPFIDLAVGKSGISPALFVVGQEYDFSLTATNRGNTDYTGSIVLTDIVPAGLTVTSVSGWSCAPIPLVGDGLAELVCTRDFSGPDALEPDETTPPAIVTVEVTASGDFTNTAEVATGPDANLPDENASNDRTSYDGTGAVAGNSADISVAKSASVASLAVGELQSFDIEVINLGPDTATDVRVRDSILSLINELDSGPNPGFVSIAYNNISAADANCSTSPIGDSGRELACTIASLDVCTPGVDCPVVTVEVRPGGEEGGRTNTVTAVSFGTPDTDRDNNEATAPYAVLGRADITIEKVVSATEAEAGQLLTYVITGINKDDGLSTAENMIITDILPDDLTFLSATPSQGTCGTQPAANSVTSPTNNQIECAIGDVANGVQQTVTVTVRPNFELIGATITNSATVATDTIEVGTGDETASVDVTIQPASLDLLIQKADSVDPVALDEQTVYSVTVRNLGPSATQNVVVEDVLPAANLTILSVDDGDGDAGTDSCTPAIPSGGQIGGTLTCTYPYLAAGESIVISVTAEGQSKGTAVNSATVESSETLAGYDTNLDNNEVDESTTVRTRSDVEVTSKIATPATVSLRDAFNFTIRATVNVGPGLVEADDVLVSDTLPAGMELTGTPTVAVVQGSVTASTCTGVASETSFSCDLRTFSPDFSGPSDVAGIVDITVPVRVVSISSDPQTFTNSAEISTTSLDADPSNDDNDGDVAVNASTLSGTLFRDFNDDGTSAASDTGVGGITITLTGLTPDGTTITRTTTTNADGTYDFGLLPEGTYSVARGTVSEAYQNDGASYPNGGNGTSTSATLIDGIALGDDDSATDNDFTVVPIARIGIAKQARGVTAVNPDGSFEQLFRLRVENFSLEALENIVVTDVLEGAAPSFGTYTAGTPAPGEYTILIAPSSNCGAGTANAAFTGAGDTVVASGITLASGSSCRIDFNISVQPTNPLPPVISGSNRYTNSATVTGEGVLSGQTSATNPLLSDISNNGNDPDPNGNGVGNDAGEDDPTPVGPVFDPGIAIIKEADTSAFSSPPAPLDTITYTFTVTNTGNMDLFNVEIADPLPGLVLTDPVIGDLSQGASVTRTATYQISQDDINDGVVENTATATGEDVYGTEVDDLSGTTNADGDDGPIMTSILQVPGVEIIKEITDNSAQDPTVPGDTITYAFSVRNSGNVTLTNVTVTDPLPGIVLVGSPIAVMEPGDVVLNAYTASYDVTGSDINAGEVRNQATATGTDPNGDPTTDLSGPTFVTDAPTVAPLSQDPSIALIKAVTTDRLGTPPQAGDFLDYQFVVTNTGNVTLTDISITDLLPGIVISGGPITLDAGAVDSTTFTAEYPLTQDDLNVGEVVNSATVTGTPPSGPDVEDDSGEDNLTDAPLVTPLDQVSAIALIKRFDLSGLSMPPVAGETVIFRFDVTNTGNQILSNVTLADNFPGVTVSGGPIATLMPEVTDSTTFTATYTLLQDDLDLGFVRNQGTVTAQDPSGDDITDDSGDTNDDDNVLQVDLDRIRSVSLIKTADTSGLSSPPEVGETIIYNFAIRNTGNVRLFNVTVTDPLTGLVLDGDPIPVLEPDVEDTTTYSGTYVLQVADVDRGFVENQARVEGADRDGIMPDDLSGDTYGVDNPLIVPLAQEPSIAVVKMSNADLVSDPAQVGDEISYTFTITNTGNVTLTNIRLTDLLPGIVLDGDPIPSMLAGAVDTDTFTATYTIQQSDIDAGQVLNQATTTGTPPIGADVDDLSGSDNGNDDPTIEPLVQNPGITLDKIADVSAFEDGSVPGESVLYSFVITNTGNVTLTDVTVTDALAGVVLTGGPIASLAPMTSDTTTYTAEYVIDADDIARGTVINDATVVGNYFDQVAGAPATVDDSDSETANVANVEANPEPYPPFATNGGVTTSVLGSDLFRGEPATLATVAIRVLTSDPEITLDPDTGLITLPPDTPAGTYEVTYEICSIEFPAICDTTTETVVQLALPSIETTKTQEVIDNGDGIEGVGDTVRYTITVENTGNVPVVDLVLADTFTAIDGSPLMLTTGPDFGSADAGSLVGNLLIDETATYIATFILDVNAVTRGGLENSVMATALPDYPSDVPGTPSPIDDLSDDGLDDDGNTSDDPTILALAPSLAFNPALSLSKTTTADVVVRGQTVPYTITVRNDSVFSVGPVDIVDALPSGLLYVVDSATYEGSPADVSVSGAVVRWEDIVVPPLTTVTATLSAIVLTGANTGDLVNVVNLIDPITGGAVTAAATAAVRLQPEPIFDCGEVIGKVFDDRNGNGYQDAPFDAAPVVSDQAYAGGKIANEAIALTDEPGVPAVRLATVDGTVITTDEHGRFSVPCAALPQDGGSNFILKLDTASLPSGYRLTTENPRVMMLTPGKMIEMNFGVSISRLVRLDLNANGFAQAQNGGTTLTPALAQGIRQLLPQIADTPAHLRLAFHVSAAANRAEVARARRLMGIVQDFIDDEWRDVGRVKLTTEQTIIRPGQ